jgi:peptidoglycan/LPS O-acetylase OafA/YrhL
MKTSANLDVLRAIAVLLVVGDHSAKIIFGTKTIAGIDINQVGHLGVLFFFVHTCLVLMYSLERQGDEAAPTLAARFYVRRIFRIYPLSICVLAAILLFHIPSSHVAGIGVIAGYRPNIPEAFANVLLVQNVFFGNQVLGVLWSLPWEVQMYIALPVLFLVLGRTRRWGMLLAAWAASVVLAEHVYLAHYLPHFLPGVIAYALSGKATRRLPAALWPVFLAGLIAMFCIAPGDKWGAVVCLALGLGIPFFREMSFRPLTVAAYHVATYSYGIYLGHLFCLWLCFSVVNGLSLPLRLVIYPCLLGAVSFYMFKCVESPGIALGSRVAKQL